MISERAHPFSRPPILKEAPGGKVQGEKGTRWRWRDQAGGSPEMEGPPLPQGAGDTEVSLQIPAEPASWEAAHPGALNSEWRQEESIPQNPS